MNNRTSFGYPRPPLRLTFRNTSHISFVMITKIICSKISSINENDFRRHYEKEKTRLRLARTCGTRRARSVLNTSSNQNHAALRSRLMCIVRAAPGKKGVIYTLCSEEVGPRGIVTCPTDIRDIFGTISGVAFPKESLIMTKTFCTPKQPRQLYTRTYHSSSKYRASLHCCYSARFNGIFAAFMMHASMTAFIAGINITPFSVGCRTVGI